MLKTKGKLLVVILFCLAVFMTGQARLAIDELVESFRDDFREMMYLPRGDSLKIIACGFEAPLADALFIKGMVYFAESIHRKDKSDRRLYTYELFDVITELSPRFTRAYQMGALLLTGSADFNTNLRGVKLLQKGIDTYADLEAKKIPVDPDARWLFHTLIANTYEINVQARMRMEGNIAGISEARNKAAVEFRAAAASPGAPNYVKFAAAGYEAGLYGGEKIENTIYATLAVWTGLYEEAEKRGDKDVLPDLESRIEELQTRIHAIESTRSTETQLSRLGKEYLHKHGQAPVGVAALVGDGLLAEVPPTPMSSEETPDSWLALPDGTFRSRTLAALETENHRDQVQHALFSYFRGASGPPENLDVLIEENLLHSIPEPPLKLLGQRYEYDKEAGLFRVHMPEGPELPPERR